MSGTVRRVGLAALLLGASQLLSRLLGVVREMVLAWLVGASPETDAYRAAFQLPDLLNHFLAVGAIATAFIPLYQRARAKGGREAAEEFLGLVWGTLTPLAILATAALFVAAPAFVSLYFPDFSEEQQRLTVRLTRIVLPAQIFFVAGGILRGALMAEGRFLAQALAPVVYNLGIIAGGLLGGRALGVEGFAWGALAGAGVGHLAIPMLDARGRLRVPARIAPFDPRFTQYVLLALPLLVGVTVVAGDEWLDRYFGQFVGGGAIALLFFARALMQAPVGLVGQAAGTAALPSLARLIEAGRGDEADALLERVLRVTLFLGVAAAAALFAVAAPLVTLVYVRGAFLPDAGAEVASLLRVFSLGVPGWVLQSVAVRGFYARGDTWRPMLLGSAILLLAIPLYAVLGARAGTAGLAAAGAATVSVNAALTLLWLRVRHGGPAWRPLLETALRSVAIALPAGAVAALVVVGRPGALGATLDLAGAGLGFALVAGVGLWWVGDAPAREWLARLPRGLSSRLRGGTGPR
ncbi:MAG: murein biosynthesis integral membrane protein MurJ [Myxococcota bacterium]|nr:murein biosynthesis integral membrane protein MurJ [Myxococcota bacterium]